MRLVERFREVWDHAPIGCQLYGRDGTSLYMNDAQRALLGLPSTTSGLGVYNALTDPWSISTGAAQQLARALAGEVVLVPTETLDFASAADLWGTRRERRLVSLRWVPVRGEDGQVEAVALLTVDTTDQQTASRRLRQIVAHSRDAIAFLATLEPELVNPAWEKLHGYTLEETRDPAVREHRWTPEARAWRERFLAAFQEKGEWPEDTVVLPWRRRDGALVLVEHAFANARDADGRVLGLLDIGRDVTGRARQEAEERALQDALAAAQRREAAGRVATMVAHDFKNLLGVIQASAEELRALAGQAPGVSEVLDDLEEARRSATELIRRLLQSTREGEGPAQRVDVSRLVQRLQRVLGKLAEPARLSLDVEAGCTVAADPLDLEQVLVNLVVNARDARPATGVTVRVVSRGAEVELQVSDDGVGMDPDVARRATEPYFTTKPAGQGTGLGLALVAAVAQRHKGRFELKSQAGQGTTATLTLPRPAA